MNNTQQAGETANLTREALRIELWSTLTDAEKKEMLPLKESYLDSLMADIDSYAARMQSTPAPDAVESESAGVWVKASDRLPGYDEKEGWRKEYHCEYEIQDWHADKSGETWTLMKTSFKSNMLKHLLNSGRNVKWLDESLTRHAEKQKATVEAKSAGVWVNELRRLLESESVKALLRFAYKNPMRSGMDDFEGKEYIDLYHFDTSVMQPSTPTSHAEGEKGAAH